MIIGHQKQWEFLKKSADSEKIPHAYLFQGEEKLGKKTLALDFVKYLNCEEKNNRPCHRCRSCIDIEKNQFPDLIFVEAEAKEIQISQIRELNRKLSLRPYISHLKAAIVDRAHLMNQEAQNCFLKTLEEPKGNSFLILVTEFPERLFPTILSRVQRLRFFPVSDQEIEKYLKAQGVPSEKFEEIIRFSFGKPGQALEFLSHQQNLDNQKKKIKELIKIINSDFSFRFQYAKDLSDDSSKIKEVLELWLRYFRALLLNSLSSENSQKKTSQYSFQKLKRITECIERINYLISNTNINQKLALEILMMEL